VNQELAAFGDGDGRSFFKPLPGKTFVVADPRFDRPRWEWSSLANQTRAAADGESGRAASWTV